MNVKQGDLAIVIRDFTNPANVGIICRVKSYEGRAEFADGEVYPHAWDVESIGRPFSFHDDLPRQDAYCDDSDLRPVSGLPVEEYDRIMSMEPA